MLNSSDGIVMGSTASSTNLGTNFSGVPDGYEILLPEGPPSPATAIHLTLLLSLLPNYGEFYVEERGLTWTFSVCPLPGASILLALESIPDSTD